VLTACGINTGDAACEHVSGDNLAIPQEH